MLARRTILFSFFIFQILFAENVMSDEKIISVGIFLNHLAVDNYALNFCIKKVELEDYIIGDPVLTYGEELKKDIQVFLKKKSDLNYVNFGFIFRENSIEKGKDIYVRIPFHSIDMSENQVTYYYNLRYILSKLTIEESEIKTDCGSAVSIQPFKVSDKIFNVIM